LEEAQLATYRIRRVGSCIVVGTEHEAILTCKNLAVARRAVADAERTQRIPTLQLLAEHAARTNAAAPPEEGGTAPADEMTSDGPDALD
jgi:hypothetical protein